MILKTLDYKNISVEYRLFLLRSLRLNVGFSNPNHNNAEQGVKYKKWKYKINPARRQHQCDNQQLKTQSIYRK